VIVNRGRGCRSLRVRVCGGESAVIVVVVGRKDVFVIRERGWRNDVIVIGKRPWSCRITAVNQVVGEFQRIRAKGHSKGKGIKTKKP